MVDYNYKTVQDNAEERKDLTDRQDTDVQLRNLAKYVMMGFGGKVAVKNVINVTLNRPKVMFNFIVAALGNTSEQILVESEEKGFDPDYIKDFRRLYFESANNRLLLQSDDEVDAFLDEQSCLRGGASLKVITQMKDGKLDIEIGLWDWRYTNYTKGVSGLLWASNGYGTKMKKADAEGQAWWEKRSPSSLTFPGKEAEVVDLWTLEGNKIYLAGQLVYEQEHKFQWADGTSHVPVVIRGVSLGSMLADEDDLKHQNESVFFLIREAMPEIQRIVSIVQTQAFLTLKPAYTVRNVDGTKIEEEDLPLTDDVTRAGAMTNADVRIITPADANRALLVAMDRMEINMTEAGFIPRQLDPPQSGIALLIEKEGQEIIQLPRLRLKGRMKTGVGHMATAQVIQIGGSIEIGSPGHQRKFDTGKLQGPYEVEHKFKVKSLATDAGLASLAAAYGDDLSHHTKLRDIYQVEDPDGEERWLNFEAAKREVPAIRLAEWAEDLVALEKGEYAEMVADFAGVQLDQLLSGSAETSKPEKKKDASQVLSLFGGQTDRRPAPKQEEVE